MGGRRVLWGSSAAGGGAGSICPRRLGAGLSGVKRDRRTGLMGDTVVTRSVIVS